MSGETSAEKISRLEQMAEGSPTWDLSDNDIAAIDWVLCRFKQAKVVLELIAADEYGGIKHSQDARRALESFK